MKVGGGCLGYGAGWMEEGFEEWIELICMMF